jgi:hypothetical protein
MLEFAHAITGATIVATIPNPLISLPLCLISNFAIDYLPHWNFHIYTEKEKLGKLSKKTIFYLFLDSFIGLVLVLLIAGSFLPDYKKSLLIIFGTFLAILGDLSEAPFYLLNWQNKGMKKLILFQRSHQWNVSFWPGIVFQILYVTFLLGLVGKIW